MARPETELRALRALYSKHAVVPGGNPEEMALNVFTTFVRTGSLEKAELFALELFRLIQTAQTPREVTAQRIAEGDEC